MDLKYLPYAPGSNGRVGELLHRITDDLKTITSDELELVKGELRNAAKTTAGDAVVVLLSANVALIGLGLLCVAVVVALAPVIPALWLRLVLMAVVYLAIGGGLARAFAVRLGRDTAPAMASPKGEARMAIDNIQHGLEG